MVLGLVVGLDVVGLFLDCTVCVLLLWVLLSCGFDVVRVVSGFGLVGCGCFLDLGFEFCGLAVC